MNFFQKASKEIDRISCYIMVVFFIGAFLATIYQVFSRYIINSKFLLETFPQVNFSIFNFTWTEELIRYLFIWIVFLGIGSVYRAKGHAHVELLLNYLPENWKRKWLLVIECINASFFILLIYLGGTILKTTSLQVSPSLNINMSLVYLSILVCSVICLIHSIAYLTVWYAESKTKKSSSDEKKTIQENITM